MGNVSFFEYCFPWCYDKQGATTDHPPLLQTYDDPAARSRQIHDAAHSIPYKPLPTVPTNKKRAFKTMPYPKDTRDCLTEQRTFGKSNYSQITDWIKKLQMNEMSEMCDANTQKKYNFNLCFLCNQIIFSQEILYFIATEHRATEIGVPINPSQELIEYLYNMYVKDFAMFPYPTFSQIPAPLQIKIKTVVAEGCKIVKAWTTLPEGLQGHFFCPKIGEAYNSEKHEIPNPPEDVDESMLVIAKVKHFGFQVGTNNLIYQKAIVGVNTKQ